MITYEFPQADSKVAKAVGNKLEAVRDALLKHIEAYNPNTTYNFIVEQEAEVDEEKFKIRISNNVLLPIHDKIKVPLF